MLSKLKWVGLLILLACILVLSGLSTAARIERQQGHKDLTGAGRLDFMADGSESYTFDLDIPDGFTRFIFVQGTSLVSWDEVAGTDSLSVGLPPEMTGKLRITIHRVE